MGRVAGTGKPEPFGHRGVFADAVCGAEDGRKMNCNFDESARARAQGRSTSNQTVIETIGERGEAKR